MHSPPVTAIMNSDPRGPLGAGTLEPRTINNPGSNKTVWEFPVVSAACFHSLRFVSTLPPDIMSMVPAFFGTSRHVRFN